MTSKFPSLRVGERKDGVWRRAEDTYVVSSQVNGVRVFKSFGSDYKSAFLYAEAIKQDAKIARLKGSDPLIDKVIQTATKKTVNEILLAYAEHRDPFLKSGTVQFYRYLLQRMMPIRGLKVSSLTLEALNSYISDLKSSGLSNKVIGEIISFGKSAFQHAIKTANLPPSKNVFASVTKPKKEKFEPKPFSSEELDRIFNELQPRLRLMFFTQFVTGMRTGEVLGLKFADIDFLRRKITIRRTRRQGVENTPKTETSKRQVFLPESAAVQIEESMRTRHAKADDYVFVTQYGDPYRDAPDEAWRVALQRAGVDHRQGYTLRHSFASHALASNLKLSYISEALGHSNVNITAQKYMRFIGDLHKEEEVKLNNLSKSFSENCNTNATAPLVRVYKAKLYRSL